MEKDGRVQRLLQKLPKNNNHRIVLIGAACAVFIIALLARLPFMSHGMDQWDVILYRNSLVHMSFFREAEWPVLLIFQKLLWLIFPSFSPQQILSLTNIILAATVLSLFFVTVYKITRSYVSSALLSLLLFYIPLFGVYSVVGMQDMAQTFAVTLFVAVILQFCLAKNISKKWLYAACFIAGLMLGIRFTMVLMLPSLLLAMLLTRKLKFRDYVKGGMIFLGGAAIWVIADIFIPSMPHAQPVGFFLSQFHAFNPNVLGYWVKAGDYVLLSGYKLYWFYWIPIFWLGVYILTRWRQKKPTWVPILALWASVISLGVAYGLTRVYGPTLGAQQFLLVVLLGLLLLYEAIRNLAKDNHYIKNITPREKSLAVICCLITTYLVFNYSFTGPVARYLLPIIPSILLVVLLLVNVTGRKSWVLAVVIVLFGYWGRPFNQTHTMVASYKMLDTRSSVAEFMLQHQGTFYDFDPNHAYGSHLETYGVLNRMKLAFAPGCAQVNTSQPNYAVFYGPAIQSVIDSCPNLTFTKAARYQRNESIIEDSIGNIGYTIYQLTPKQ